MEPETQASGVDPAGTDLAQAWLRCRAVAYCDKGVCDLSQARRIGDRGEAVAFLDKSCPCRLCGAGHVLVPA